MHPKNLFLKNQQISLLPVSFILRFHLGDSFRYPVEPCTFAMNIGVFRRKKDMLSFARPKKLRQTICEQSSEGRCKDLRSELTIENNT